ncbi:MAG: TRAP transporter large permease subunit [Salinarchaeum sp.]
MHVRRGQPILVAFDSECELVGPWKVRWRIRPDYLLAAHLFILYFGVIADITPPVAVAAYAASGVAKSDAFETGVKAFALSLNKAIVPFAFIISPGILLLKTGVEVPNSDDTYRVLTGGDLMDVAFSIPEVVIPIVSLFIGVFALGPTVIGHLYDTVSGLERTGFAVSAALLMVPTLLVSGVSDLLSLLALGPLPTTTAVDIGLRIVGGVLLLGLMRYNHRRGRHNDDVEGAPV